LYKIKEMSLENTQAQMRKGILEYCILSILDKKEAYPSEILETLKDAKLIVVEGTLYPLLTRLKNMELLSYRWEESQSGPPRKYFSLTKMGKAFLEELDSTWSELSEAVNKITNLQPSESEENSEL
jgi:PadR family transcriptional regulator, regulatory protein PadR